MAAASGWCASGGAGGSGVCAFRGCRKWGKGAFRGFLCFTRVVSGGGVEKWGKGWGVGSSVTFGAAGLVAVWCVRCRSRLCGWSGCRKWGKGAFRGFLCFRRVVSGGDVEK